jgi:hypothetical protein
MHFRKLPTQARIRELLDYNAETGVFLWRDRGPVKGWKQSLVGTAAGTPNEKGVVIYVDGKPFYAHRLAWAYINGTIPEQMQVDHRDCDCWNNRWANLRLATHGQNASNARKKSGMPYPKGVRPQRRGGGFMARIQHQKRHIHLGTFPTIEAAHAAYVEAAQQLKGQFARAA